MEEGSLKHELEATIAARQEMGRELEPELVEQFVDKVEQEIDRRAQELARQRRPEHPVVNLPLALGSLGIAIPLMGIAGGIAKLSGIIAVCIAIVLVNLLWTIRR
jgi:hypothetical protein